MTGTPSAQYSLTLRVEIDHLPGMLGKVASAIGAAGATIGGTRRQSFCSRNLVGASHELRDDAPSIADLIATGAPGSPHLVGSADPEQTEPGGEHRDDALHQREASHGYFWIILDNEA